MIVGLIFGALFALIYVLSNRLEAWKKKRKDGPFPQLFDPIPPTTPPEIIPDIGPSGERAPPAGRLVTAWTRFYWFVVSLFLGIVLLCSVLALALMLAK